MFKITKIVKNKEWLNKILYKLNISKAAKNLVKFVIISFTCMHLGGCL